MQFILTAYDGKDPGALQRRMAVRESHFAKVRDLKSSSNFIWGGAILGDSGEMIGSVVLYEFPDREALDRMLADEPYVTGGVWKEIDIRPFRLADV